LALLETAANCRQGRTRLSRVRPKLLYTGGMYKVVVYVPVVNADEIRKVIGDAGGGRIGNYSHCSFSVRGKGRFRPLEGARPSRGKVGKWEEVEEERIEFVCSEELLEMVVKAIRKAHPYEEPAIEVSPLVNIS